MPDIALALLSGAAGAILATALATAFHFWRDRVNAKGQALLSFVDWYQTALWKRGRYAALEALLSKPSLPTSVRDRVEWERLDVGFQMQELVAAHDIRAELELVLGPGAVVDLAGELMEKMEEAVVDQLYGPSGPPELDSASAPSIWKQEVAPIYRKLRETLIAQGSFPFVRANVLRAVQESWDGVDRR